MGSKGPVKKTGVQKIHSGNQLGGDRDLGLKIGSVGETQFALLHP